MRRLGITAVLVTLTATLSATDLSGSATRAGPSGDSHRRCVAVASDTSSMDPWHEACRVGPTDKSEPRVTVGRKSHGPKLYPGNVRFMSGSE